MFKTILTGALALGALGAAAQAAPAPVYDWTGLYIGGFAGGFGGSVTPYPGDGPSGLDVGVTLGYAWQGNGDWVFTPFIAVPIIAKSGTYSGSYISTRTDWAVLAGLKVGIAVDRWQPYAFVAALVGGGSATNGTDVFTNTHHGVSFGVGADYALTDRWSIGARLAHVAVDQQEYFGSPFGLEGNSFAVTFGYKLK